MSNPIHNNCKSHYESLLERSKAVLDESLNDTNVELQA